MLLAEDDAALRRYIEVLLERAGYEVVSRGGRFGGDEVSVDCDGRRGGDGCGDAECQMDTSYAGL